MIDEIYRERLARAVQPDSFDLAAIHEDGPPLGFVPRLKPIPKIHEPRLNLADYVEKLAAPPAAVHRSHLDFPWGMLLNNRLGDCGDAMVIHGIEAFHLDAGTPVPLFVDLDAEHLYSAVSGYVPGDPSTDQGTDNAQLTNYWQSTGVRCGRDGSRHKIAASIYVDPSDPVLARIAIWEFVARFWAVGLPASAETQSGKWTVTNPSLRGDAAVGSWGYHDVPDISYDSTSVRLLTWGRPWLKTWEFDRAYGVQSFVVITPEQLNLKGISPSGVNWTKLNADAQKLPSVPAA